MGEGAVVNHGWYIKQAEPVWESERFVRCYSEMKFIILFVQTIIVGHEQGPSQ